MKDYCAPSSNGHCSCRKFGADPDACERGIELIDMPVRLPDDILLKLAMLAHRENIPLNELMVGALALAVAEQARRHQCARSRNKREGEYMGRYHGKVYRSLNQWLRLVRDIGLLERRHLYGIRAKADRRG